MHSEQTRILVVLMMLAVPGGAALAQEQQCSGNAPQVTWTLGVANPDGSIIDIDNQFLGGIINAAECECEPKDLVLIGKVTKATNQMVTPEVWLGTNCQDIQSQPSNCEQVTSDLDGSTFTAGASASPVLHLDVRALISPRTQQNALGGTSHQCISTASLMNSVYVLFPIDPANPDYCSVELKATTTTPAAPVEVAAMPSGHDVVLTWQSPPPGTPDAPLAFQVLCADADGNPIANQGARGLGDPANAAHAIGYDVCLVGTPQGGQPGTVLGIERRPLARGAGAGAPAGSSSLPLTSLDERFVVSDAIVATGSPFSFSVPGVKGGTTYSCLVVGVDGSGNATPSAVVSATTPPCAGSECDPQLASGCAIGPGRATDAPVVSMFVVLALIAGLIARRRRVLVRSR